MQKSNLNHWTSNNIIFDKSKLSHVSILSYVQFCIQGFLTMHYAVHWHFLHNITLPIVHVTITITVLLQGGWRITYMDKYWTKRWLSFDITYMGVYTIRVSTTSANTGNLLEFEIPSGNLLEFNCSSWKFWNNRSMIEIQS